MQTLTVFDLSSYANAVIVEGRIPLLQWGECQSKTIEGQVPNPEWDQKLTTASKKFRKMKDKAAAYVSPGTPSADVTTG